MVGTGVNSFEDIKTWSCSEDKEKNRQCPDVYADSLKQLLEKAEEAGGGK
jgi:hypothetical protein